MPNHLLDPPVDPIAWFEDVRRRMTERMEILREENGHVQRVLDFEARDRLDIIRSHGYPAPGPDDL